MSIVQIEAIIRHEYFLVIYGIIVYFTILYSIEKTRKGKVFTWKWFKNEYKDDLFGALMIAPLIVAFDDEMLNWYNNLFEKDIAFGKWFYLCAGPIFNILLTAVKRMLPKRIQ